MHAQLDFTRRLPADVALGAGESFVSWVERVSASIDAPVANVLGAFGMTRDGTEGVPFYGVFLQPWQLERVASCTGHSVARIHSSLLVSLADELPSLRLLPDSQPRRCGGIANSVWASLRGSRCCETCVEESGAWQLRWRLSTALVCTAHGRLLRDRCPRCGLLPGRGSRRVQPSFRHLVANPGFCANPAVDSDSCDPRCGRRLASSGGDRRATAAERDAQEVVDRVADDRAAVLWGEVVPAAVWFEALRDVVALIKALAQPDDLVAARPATEAFVQWAQDRDQARTKGDAAPSLTAPPRAVEFAAALVPNALQAMSTTKAAEGLECLVRRGAMLGRTRWRAVPSRLGLGSAVTEGWRDATRPMVGFSTKASIGRRLGGYGFCADHVPHLIPVERFTELVHLLPGTSALVGRAFLSVALARVAEGCSWAVAATRLGVSPERAKRLADAVRSRVDADALWLAVQRLGDKWPSYGLVDYGRRRAALAAVVEIDPVSFSAMRQAVGIGPGWAKACRRNGAAWAWEHVAGGDARTSPALVAAEAVGLSRSSVREVYRRFRIWLPGDLRLLLTQWALGVCGEAQTSIGAAA